MVFTGYKLSVLGYSNFISMQVERFETYVITKKTLICLYQIVIKFVHSCVINIYQAKNSQTKKNNLEKYISPLPRLIIINVSNLFGEFSICINTVEFYIQYDGLKKFVYPQLSVHSHEISSHHIIIYAKRPIFLLWKSQDFDLNTELGL